MYNHVYIEFTKPKGKILPLFSWAIRAFQKTPYSHVRLRWVSKSGVEIIYEASGTKVKIIGEEAQDQFKVHVIKRYRVDLSKEEYRELIRLFKYSSVDYGALQAVGIGISIWLRLSRNILSTKGQVCSELMTIFMEKVKNWPINLNKNLAGPLEVDVALEKIMKNDNSIKLEQVV